MPTRRSDVGGSSGVDRMSARGGGIDVAEFDPMGPELPAELHETLADLRTQPVGQTSLYGGIWLGTAYDDVLAGLRDWETFSSEQGSVPIPLEDSDFRPIPLFCDPPHQRMLRTMIDRFFGPKAISVAEESIRAIAHELLSRTRDLGTFDFMNEFAGPMAYRVLFDVAFGVGARDSVQIMHWMEAIESDPGHSAEAGNAVYGWVVDFVEARRSGKRPRRDDVVQSLLEAATGDDPSLSEGDVFMVLMNLIGGGTEAVVSGLGTAAYFLTRDSDLRDGLLADRSLIPAAIEEILRLEPPVPALGRVTTCPASLGGRSIASQSRVALYVAAANRDPSKYDDPDRFALGRFATRGTPHLSFGSGTHRCPGLHLARLQLRILIELLLDHDSLHIADGHCEWTGGIGRKLRSLTLAWP